jgi:ribonucrease Y
VLIGIGVAVGIVGGAVLALLAVQVFGATGVGKARKLRRQIVEDAEREADAARREAQIEAREQAVKLRAEIDAELADRRQAVLKIEERVLAKEEEVERKLVEIVRRDQGIADRETHLRALQEELKAVKNAQQEALERIGRMTQQEAKTQLLDRGEELVRHDLARRVRMLEEEARAESKRRARNLVADALQRVAASHAAETTVTVVELPSDDMKGRIIGREGRNIRALEHLTGVDFIIDDTPHAVVLSSFDGIRREVARLTLTKLIEDGRIHPARIEETYYQSKAELEEIVRQAGEQAVFEANCGPFHEELQLILGRLRFRTSYGQNVLRHSVEVAFLAQMIADELRLDGTLARRAGLLHDIGKSMDHDQEGGHPAIGMEFVRKFNEPETVLNAIGGHHNDIPATTPYTPIIMAADAISGARPGARRETLERYIKRLQDLEGIATSFPGVKQAFAIQAGREVRVIVDPERCDDATAKLIARDVAKRIQAEMTYPGEIRVTVLREIRAVDFAR